MTSTPNFPPVTPAQALERLARLSLRELSLESLLQTVADLAKNVMPGESETSVTLLVKNRPSTVAATGRLAVELDEAQYEHGDGPCLHAARTGDLTEIVDTRTEPRWGSYPRRAAEHGNLSSLSVPLIIDEDQRVTGALNIYARTPYAFDGGSRAAASQFAPYAAVAAGNMYAYQSAREMADNLQRSLESRAVIDQAKGILMERYKLTADQAFQLLTQVSMNVNLKLRDLAETLVHTGELPIWPPRGPARRRRAQPSNDGAGPGNPRDT
jgi:GAF domain-containing protein